MLETIRSMPDGATIDDAIERLEVMEMVERGIAAADASQTVSQAEARGRIAQDLSKPDRMEPTISKAEMLTAIQSLPRDATLDEAIHSLEFVELLKLRIAQAETDPGIPHEEVRRRFGLSSSPSSPSDVDRRHTPVISKTHRPFTKDEILEAVRRLPDDATVDDAMECLYLLAKIEIAEAAADAGDTFTQEEVERQMAEWQE